VSAKLSGGGCGCIGQVADILTARGALAAAHAGTRLPGSTTACVVRLNRPHRTIDAANLVRPALSAHGMHVSAACRHVLLGSRARAHVPRRPACMRWHAYFSSVCLPDGTHAHEAKDWAP
jgi:hypothetical protein